MVHLADEKLQLYLAGELDLMEREEIAEHLAACPLCTDRLAALAAEDAALKEALALDAAEAAWAESLDLTGPVLAAITPWYRQPHGLLLIALLLLGGGWGLSTLGRALERLVAGQGAVGLALDLIAALVEGLWAFLIYLSRGGLLVHIWPVVALGGAIWLWQQRQQKKEA